MICFGVDAAGNPIPVVRGWLRASHQKLNSSDPLNSPHLTIHSHRSADVQIISPGKKYVLDIEFWPTTVIIAKGGRLQVEVAGNDDPEVSERYGHDDAIDR